MLSSGVGEDVEEDRRGNKFFDGEEGKNRIDTASATLGAPMREG